MDNENRKRCYVSEREAILDLFVVVSILEDSVIPNLKQRAKMVKRLPGTLALVEKLAAKVLQQILTTVPVEQQLQLKRNMTSVAYTTGVKHVANHADDDYGLYLSNNQIHALVEATSDRCLICTKSPQEERECPLRLALDTVGTDIEHDHGCGYRLI